MKPYWQSACERCLAESSNYPEFPDSSIVDDVMAARNRVQTVPPRQELAVWSIDGFRALMQMHGLLTADDANTGGINRICGVDVVEDRTLPPGQFLMRNVRQEAV